MSYRDDGGAKAVLALLAVTAAAAYAVFILLAQGTDLGAPDWGSQAFINAILCLALAVILTLCIPVFWWNMRLRSEASRLDDRVVCYRKVKDGRAPEDPAEEPEVKGKMPRE